MGDGIEIAQVRVGKTVAVARGAKPGAEHRHRLGRETEALRNMRERNPGLERLERGATRDELDEPEHGLSRLVGLEARKARDAPFDAALGRQAVEDVGDERRGGRDVGRHDEHLVGTEPGIGRKLRVQPVGKRLELARGRGRAHEADRAVVLAK